MVDNIYEVIPEERIRIAANLADDVVPQEDNSFKQLLTYGDKFKAINLVPIYILNTKTSEIFVTSTESLLQKFH